MLKNKDEQHKAWSLFFPEPQAPSPLTPIAPYLSPRCNNESWLSYGAQ
jgi:hypothetical protein